MIAEKDREKADMVFAHADKIRAITDEELAREMEWQDGQGLIEIINNVLIQLEQVKHAGRIKRIIALDAQKKDLLLRQQLFVTPGFKKEWAEFILHRKTKKAPMTEHSRNLILATLAERPTDAEKALQMAITHNWTGFHWEWYDKVVSSPQGKPDYLYMTWPKEWQEAKRQVRFLQTKVNEHPAVKERIEALTAQFKL